VGQTNRPPSRADVTNCLVVTHIASVQKLQDAQPLAHRVLRRIRVSCPLLRHGCSWQGDYGDLHAHLLSSTAHADISSSQRAEPPLKRPNNNNNGSSSSSTTIKDGRVHQQHDNRTNSNDDEFQLVDWERRRALAATFKEEANGKFAAGSFGEAQELYSKALSLLLHVMQQKKHQSTLSSSATIDDEEEEDDDDCIHMMAMLYANRAAAHVRLRQHDSCVRDCSEAIRLDPTYIKAFMRRAKSLIDVGKFEEAYRGIANGCQKNPTNSTLAAELIRVREIRDHMALGLRQLEEGEFAVARASFGTVLRETKSNRVVVAAAKAEVGLGLTDRAMRLSLQVIRADSTYAEGYEVRALCMLMNGELDNAVKLFREALRLDPDCHGAKVALKKCRTMQTSLKEARQKVFHRDFAGAVTLFTFIIDSCQPFPSKSNLYCMLFTERAEAHLRLKQYERALSDAAKALYGRNDLPSAWIVKAHAYRGLGRDEDAFSELSVLMETWGAGNDAIRKAYERADFEVRKKKRPDYYKLFGVPSIASEMEIKKQYKVRAKDLHPDRFSGGSFTDAQRKEAEENFKSLGEGLEVLCDDFKRQLYDEGYDREAIQERVAAAQRAAHRSQGDYHRGHHG